MDKKSLSFCLQILLACWVFSLFVSFAYQKPKELKKPFYTLPYVELAYTRKENPALVEATQATFLDASPLFLATAYNATCLPTSQLPLGAILPLETVLEPLLSLSQNLKILPLQLTLISDPTELALWNYSVQLEPGPPLANVSEHFGQNTGNIQLLNLLSGVRTSLSLDFSLKARHLPILEDLELLSLRDCSGYTLPVLKRNTLGDEILDQTVLEALTPCHPFSSGQTASYEAYRISL